MSRRSFVAFGHLNGKPLLLAALLAGTLLVAACGQKPATAPAAAPAPPPSAPVTAQTATRGGIQQTLSYSGDIRAREQVSVLPKGTGRVEQILVDIGSRVKAGDTIAILDQDNPQAQLLLARATLAQAQAKMESLQGGPRIEDVASAQAAVNQQQARLQNMRTGGRAEDIKSAAAGLSAAEATVPREAVLIGAPGSEALVIAIDSAGRVHRQPVKLGLQSDRAIEISSGLDDGQLVATSNLNDLADGDIVAPQVEIRVALAR
jgi:multidrug efflux pump subunit AcrA (membrane-fusion protein)